MNTLKTLERTETEKALSLNGNGSTTAQSLGRTETVYCQVHGVVKGFHGHCEECYDQGLRNWHEMIPSWTGLETDGRQVIVAPVKDALGAVQTINRYKNSDALILIAWGRVLTALDKGRIGPSWTLQDADDDVVEVECVRCCQPFVPTMGDEQLCETCWLREHGPRR